MTLIGVEDADGTVVLYDMFIDGVWHGSCRTISQCRRYATHRGVRLNCIRYSLGEVTVP